MERADKAVLRLAIGLALAVLLAYGLALPSPFVLCVMTVLMLSKPGPPMPLLKGVVVALLVAAVLAAGVLMVPLLEHYASVALVLTALLLYTVFFIGLRSGSPLAIVVVIAFTVIPVAGVADQALVPAISTAIALGLGVGVLVGSLSHALFPDGADPAARPAPPAVAAHTARWRAVQATLVVMPVLVLALVNPAFYLSAIIKSVLLGQQAGATGARSAGRILVGSTLAGAGMATVAWFGLAMLPTLWMLVLWMAAAALWSGVRIFGLKASRLPPSFWSNALVTMLILLGPAIEDSVVGKDVGHASLVRVSLFIALALYAWAVVWALEGWRAARALRLGRVNKQQDV
ncbi:DUF2955 domain-containing protein [Massilia timonae]|uniref:DUF2955 domain-containing protein n=1 Tax=Massilia timonae TaxID=47229 RepID=UPI0028D2B05D|nr:DUF2955 domain-containing protein [Massilia timonae]